MPDKKPRGSRLIEIKTIWLSGNVVRKMHFTERRKYRKALCAEIAEAVSFRTPPAPYELAVVKLRRYSPSLLDHDNLFGGIKALLDCLVPVSKRHPSGLGFVTDDNPASLIVDVDQSFVEKSENGKSTIEITEIFEEDKIYTEKIKSLNLSIEQARNLRKIRMAS